MIRRPPRSTLDRSSAASDVYKRQTLNIYSFLCKLQTHNKKSYFGFDLGNCGNIFTYIPRIEFKNIILSLATWNLSKKHFIEIIESNSKNNFEEAVSLFSDFRKKYKIPTKVLLADVCLLYTSPSPRDRTRSRMPSSAR